MELTLIHARVLSYGRWHRWDSVFIPKPHSPAQPGSAMLSMAPNWAPSRWPPKAELLLYPMREETGAQWRVCSMCWLLMEIADSCETQPLSCMLLKVFRYSIPHLQPSCLSVVYIQGLQQGKANKVISNMCLNLMDSDSVTNDI